MQQRRDAFEGSYIVVLLSLHLSSIPSRLCAGGSPKQAAWHTLFGPLNNETLNAWTMVPATLFALTALLLCW